jgi:hypothetical protein
LVSTEGKLAAIQHHTFLLGFPTDECFTVTRKLLRPRQAAFFLAPLPGSEKLHNRDFLPRQPRASPGHQCIFHVSFLLHFHKLIYPSFVVDLLWYLLKLLLGMELYESPMNFVWILYELCMNPMLIMEEIFCENLLIDLVKIC